MKKKYSDRLTRRLGKSYSTYKRSMIGPAGTVLGRSCTNIACPLANYFDEVTGLPYWSVGDVIRCGDGRGIKLRKPGFVNPLIARVDAPSPQDSRIDSRDVTREQFLQALQTVKEEHEAEH